MRMLNINSPSFLNDLREAIGAKPGEVIEFTTPQFKRTDGVQVPIPAEDWFERMPDMPKETLKAIGCQLWDEGHWLYPAEWYDYIPEGHVVCDINGKYEKFKRGVTDNDMRCGALAYGFKTTALGETEVERRGGIVRG